MKIQKPNNLTEKDIERILDEAFRAVFGREYYDGDTERHDILPKL
jgi:hypothetical protein